MMAGSAMLNTGRNAARLGKNFRRIIFSGIQPTGIPHLGNYLGAIKPWVALQNNKKYDEVIYSIVDLHAMTAENSLKNESLRKQSLDMACALLACGIDPSRVSLYRQSQIPEHTMMYWLFACQSTLPRLYHLTQWRQKMDMRSRSKKSTNVPPVDVGLFTYPLLQAADILLFKATHVPVGEDQIQHLRLTQEIARKFNNVVFPRNCNYFPIPQLLVAENTECSRLHSLRNPAAKMSKTDKDKRSRINLDDDPDTIRLKLRKAVTDMSGKISFDPENRPGVSNLVTIHSAVTGKSIDSIVNSSEIASINTGRYKMLIADCVIEELRPIRERINELRSDLASVEKILDDSADKIRNIASRNWKEITSLIGL